MNMYKIPYLFEYKAHFFVPNNRSKNRDATDIQGFVCFSADMHLTNSSYRVTIIDLIDANHI